MKKADAAALYNMLSPAKMTKGDLAAKLKLVAAIIATKAVAEELADREKTLRDKIKPEGYDAIMEKVRANAKVTPEEFNRINDTITKHEREVADGMKKHREAVVEVDMDPWSTEAYNTLIDCNDFSGDQMVMLQRLLMEAPAKEAAGRRGRNERL